MTDEFTKRFAAKVASFFPFREAETFDEYLVRVRGEDDDRRAVIASYIVKTSEDMSEQRQAKKTAWIAAARLRFNPGARCPCAVCGKYEGLTEAHHIVPLGVQFDAGATSAIQDHEWLCPTHHVAQHFLIRTLIGNVDRSIPGMPPDESDTLHRLGVRFVDLFMALPDWQAVQK